MQRRNNCDEGSRIRRSGSAVKMQRCPYGMGCPYINSTCKKTHLSDEEEKENTAPKINAY